MLDSIFNKVALKRGSDTDFFPVNIATFLRIPFSQKTTGGLLLNIHFTKKIPTVYLVQECQSLIFLSFVTVWFYYVSKIY